jgi:hypothetical protein
VSAFCLQKGTKPFCGRAEASIMKQTDINFLRRQAELCIALSRATFDLTVAGRLRTMAEEFRAKASRWEDEVDEMPAHVVSHNGSSDGKLDRG